MDTDNDQEPQCGICLTTLRQGLLSRTMCGHVLHSACLRTWYAGTSLKCPVCNSSQRINLHDISCTPCRNSVQGLIGDGAGDGDGSALHVEAHLVLSMKCGHVHRPACQASYMATLGTRYQITPTDYLPFLQSIHEGCTVCAGGPNGGPTRDIARIISAPVPRGPHVSSYMPDIPGEQGNRN